MLHTLQPTYRRLMHGTIAVFTLFSLFSFGFADFLLDDLEHGKNGPNGLGEYWYTFNDRGILTNHKDTLQPISGGYGGSDWAVGMVFGSLVPTATNDYATVGLGTGISSSKDGSVGYGTGFDVVTGFSFYAKGPNGLKFHFDAETIETAQPPATTRLTDNTYTKTLTKTGNDWEKFTVLITDLAQEDWGAETVKFTFKNANVTKLSWKLKVQDNANLSAGGTFLVDDVYILGTFTHTPSVTPPTPTIPKYTLTYAVAPGSQGMGSIVIAGESYTTKTFELDSNATVTTVIATPATGYRFVTWSDNSTATTRNDRARADATYTATFEAIPVVPTPTYTITYTAGTGGKLKVGTAATTVATHTTAALATGERGDAILAVPDDNYEFASWSDGGASASRSDLAGSANATFTATFRVKPVTVAYACDAAMGGLLVTGGGSTPVPTYSGSLTTGESVTVTATPAAGYRFVKWSDDVATAARTDAYAGGAVDVEALFAAVVVDPGAEMVSLTYTAGTGGKVQLAGAAATLAILREVAKGESGPAITAVPDNGYIFVKWSDGKTEGTRTDVAAADLSVAAEFTTDGTSQAFTLNFTAGTGGMLIVGSGTEAVATFTVKVAAGDLGPDVTAKESDGYRFVRWSDFETSPIYYNMNVRADLDVTAIFESTTISVAEHNREIPSASVAEAVSVAPLVITAGEITAGPSPASLQSGAVSIFRSGLAIKAGKLAVYDGAGNLVKKISLSDKGAGKRVVGSWDLKDGKRRPVAEGAYLVKGVITTKSGVKERVSVLVAVVK